MGWLAYCTTKLPPANEGHELARLQLELRWLVAFGGFFFWD